jgi:tetratricopeptide (TPR) repeat protein
VCTLGLRFVNGALPPRAAIALWAASGLYFLFLAAGALRTAMGARMSRALPACLLATAAAALGLMLSTFSRGFLYYLASPFFLYYAYLFFASDVRSIGSGLRSRQSFRRHLEAAAINPRDADAHYQLGLIYQQRRQYDEAIARFRKAVEIDPDDPDAHFQLGRIAREQTRHADALVSLERAAALDDRHSGHEVWRELGVSRLHLGHVAEAQAALEKYVDRRPYDPEGLYWYGKTLRRLGRAAEAAEVFERAIEAVNTMPHHRIGKVRGWSRQAAAELKTLRLSG